MENSVYLAKPYETIPHYTLQSAPSTGDSLVFQPSPSEQDCFSDEQTAKKLRPYDFYADMDGDSDIDDTPYDPMMDCYIDKGAQEGQLKCSPYITHDDSQDSYEFSIFISNSSTPSQEEQEQPAKLQKKSKKIKKEKAQDKTKKERQVAAKKNTKGFWTPEEDNLVIQLYEKHGSQWAKLASEMKNRTRKQIRDRYLNALRPDINYDEFTQEEEVLFASLIEQFGKKWVKIASYMPGRTESQVKNKYYKPYKKTSNMSNHLARSASDTTNSSYQTTSKNRGFVLIPENVQMDKSGEEPFLSSEEDDLSVKAHKFIFSDSFEEIDFSKMDLQNYSSIDSSLTERLR